MKKILIAVFFTIILSVNAFASEEILPQDISGMEEARNSLSSEAREYADKNDAGNISFFGIFADIFSLIKEKASAPFKLFAVLCAIAIMYAALESFKDGDSGEMSGIYGVIAVTCAGVTAISNISGVIEGIINSVNELSVFMKSFVPVLSSVMAVGGHVGTASVYNLTLLGCSELFISIAESFCLPLLGCYLALCICSSVNDDMNLSGLAGAIKTFVITIIGICMTVFVGLLTVQGFVAKSGDTVAMKTAKFAVGSFVPIVGGAISDALASVQGSIGLIKASTGAYGIIAGIATVAPMLIIAFLTKLAVEASAAVSEIIGAPKLTNLYKSLGSLLTVMLSIILSASMVMIISTAVMLMICGG